MAIRHRFKEVIIPIEGNFSSFSNIENSLKNIGGIDFVSFHLSTKTIIVKYDEDSINLDKIIAKIRESGFNPLSILERYVETGNLFDLNIEKGKKSYFLRFLISVVSLFFLFCDYIFNFSSYTLLFLSGFVWIYCGLNFHRDFFRSFKKKSANFNVLVSISSSVAFLYSFVSYIADFSTHFVLENLYLQLSVLIITFSNLWKYLELKIYSENQDSNLAYKIIPEFSTIIEENENKKIIKTKEIKKGDRILVKSFQRCPVDGKIAKGKTIFDESIIKGGCEFSEKFENDFVYAGSINKGEDVEIIAENNALNTILNKIVLEVKNSRNINKIIPEYIDRISSFLTPLIIAIAFFAGTYWFLTKNFQFALAVFVSLLVFSFPFFITLSLPLLIYSGFLRSSKIGFLIKNPDIFFEFEKIDVIIFDKSFTNKNMRISEIKPWKISEKDFLKFLFTAVKKSQNPFFEVVKKYCFSEDIECYDVDQFSVYEKGIIVKNQDFEILAGEQSFIRENKIKIPDSVMKELNSSDYFYVLVVVNYKYVGYIAFQDVLKLNIKDTINSLKKQGIIPVIASQDKKENIEKIAKELNIEDFYFGVNPEEKYSLVLRYKAFGKKVLIIGENIYDSIAINEADVGVALNSSSEITKDLSSVILMRDDLSLILKLFVFGTFMKKVIKQNLVLSFLYNIILLPFATGIFYAGKGFLIRPYIVFIAFALNFAMIIFNSLRLLKIDFEFKNKLSVL